MVPVVNQFTRFVRNLLAHSVFFSFLCKFRACISAPIGIFETWKSSSEQIQHDCKHFPWCSLHVCWLGTEDSNSGCKLVFCPGASDNATDEVANLASIHFKPRLNTKHVSSAVGCFNFLPYIFLKLNKVFTALLMQGLFSRSLGFMTKVSIYVGRDD